MILITHDLGLAARRRGNIAIMEQGCIVEHRPAATPFQAARHPYAKCLIAASPTRGSILVDLAQADPEATAALAQTIPSARPGITAAIPHFDPHSGRLAVAE